MRLNVALNEAIDLGIVDEKFKENYSNITELKNRIIEIENKLLSSHSINLNIEESILKNFKEKLKLKTQIKHYLSELNELNK